MPLFSDNPLSRLLAKALNRFDMGAASQVSGYMNKVVPDFDFDDIRNSPEYEFLDRSVGDAVIRPAINIGKTLAPWTEENEAFRSDFGDMMNPERGRQAARSTPYEVMEDGTLREIGAVPTQIEGYADPQLPPLQEIDESPAAWRQTPEDFPQDRGQVAGQGGNPLADLLQSNRDYGAEADAQRNKDLAQMLLAFGQGMGSAPLGDVSGGMAAGGGAWGEVYGNTLSREDYIAGQQDKDLARTGAKLDIAGKLQDVMTPDADAQQRAMFLEMIKQQIPTEKHGEALYFLGTKDWDSLSNMLGYSSGDTANLSGMRVQVRMGPDGFEEHLFPGMQGQWISTQHPEYNKVASEVYGGTPAMTRHIANKEYAAEQGSGSGMAQLLNPDLESGDRSYSDIYNSPEVRDSISAFHSMTPEQQDAEIQRHMDADGFQEEFKDKFGEYPTVDTLRAWLGGAMEGLQ